jgi:hypothetical protein
MRTVLARTLVCAALLISTAAHAQSSQAGIGVQIERSAMGAKILAVAPGGPADRAGLHAGDVILSVNNATMPGLDVDAMAASMRGPIGSAIKLLITSPNGTGRTVYVIRGAALPMPAPQPQPQPAPAPQQTAVAAPTASAGAPARAPARAAMPASAAPAVTAAPAEVQFASWTEPKEHAFTVDVPRGWQVVGGVSWHSQTDAQGFLRATSPDGKVQIFIGDPDLLPRQVPMQVYGRPFGREGQQFAIPTGGVGVWQRYATGAQTAQQHIMGHRLCQNARVVWSGDRPEETRSLQASLVSMARQYNARVTASAGDAGFLCDDAQGYVFAATVMAASATNNVVAAWGVITLAGFVSADPMQSMQARVITEHMMATMKADPAWSRNFEEVNRRVTGNYISMQNATMDLQNSASRSASNDLSRLNHPNAGVPSRTSSTSDSRNSTNTIMGTRDVCDAIGRCKTVSNDAESIFMDHSGNAVPGKAGGAPPDNSGVWSPTFPRP